MFCHKRTLLGLEAAVELEGGGPFKELLCDVRVDADGLVLLLVRPEALGEVPWRGHLRPTGRKTSRFQESKEEILKKKFFGDGPDFSEGLHSLPLVVVLLNDPSFLLQSALHNRTREPTHCIHAQNRSKQRTRGKKKTR